MMIHWPSITSVVLFLVIPGTSSFLAWHEVHGKISENLAPSWERAPTQHDKKYGLCLDLILFVKMRVRISFENTFCLVKGLQTYKVSKKCGAVGGIY